MVHVRKQIRDAIAARLTGLATTGSRVSANRVHPVAKSAAPTLAIYTTQEESEVLSMGADMSLERSLTVVIEGLVQGDGFDDTADQITAEVETALANTDLGGLARTFFLTDTEFQMNGDGEQKIGTVRLSYRAEYLTRASSPNLSI